MKRFLSLLFAAVLAFGLCFTLGSCACDPFEIETWYLDSYDNCSVGFDEFEIYDCIYSDEATLRFSEDGTFEFYNFGETLTGTYEYARRKENSFVTLTFSDGRTAQGYCGKYMFDGTWYTGEFTIFGKSYVFGDRGNDYYCRQNHDLIVREHAEELVEYSVNKKWTIGRYVYYYGEVVFENNAYVFRPLDGEREETVVFSPSGGAVKINVYEIGGNYEVAKGELKEGKCAFAARTAWLYDGYGSDNERMSVYALWYLDDMPPTEEQILIEAYERKWPEGGKASVLHYYGKFESGALVALMTGENMGYAAALWEEYIGEYVILYSDSNRAYAYYGGEFFTLSSAYEQRILTDEDIKEISGGNKESIYDNEEDSL